MSPSRSSLGRRVLRWLALTAALCAAAPVWAAEPAPEAAAPPPAAVTPGDIERDPWQAPIHDPSATAMRAFHRALAQAEAGKAQLRVAFWGASHTAADFWTGHIRRQLQARTADAGHGYILPVRWHLGLRHQDVNVRASRDWTVHRHRQLDPVPVGDFGYGGVAFSSNDPSSFVSISTCTENVCGRKADRFELWVRRGPKAGSLRVVIDGKPRVVRTQAAEEAVGFEAIALPDGAHEIEFRPVGDGEVYLYGVVFERSGPGTVVDAMGIPGMRGAIWLNWRLDRFREMVRRRAPHLVVLAYGTNAVGDDAPAIEAQREAWREVLLRARAVAPGASCLVIGPTDRPNKPDAGGVRAPRPRQNAVVQMQREVAAEFGCGHWDAVAAMGGQGSMARWVQAGLARGDWVHLSEAGYTLLAERLLDAMLRGYRPPAAPPAR